MDRTEKVFVGLFSSRNANASSFAPGFVFGAAAGSRMRQFEANSLLTAIRPSTQIPRHCTLTPRVRAESRGVGE
jgi:hypothetical protein